jgi:hypothetical protein
MRDIDPSTAPRTTGQAGQFQPHADVGLYFLILHKSLNRGGTRGVSHSGDSVSSRNGDETKPDDKEIIFGFCEDILKPVPAIE